MAKSHYVPICPTVALELRLLAADPTTIAQKDRYLVVTPGQSSGNGRWPTDGQPMANRAAAPSDASSGVRRLTGDGAESQSGIADLGIGIATLPSQHLYVEMNWSCQSSPIEASEFKTSRLPTWCAWFPNMSLKECDENGHFF